jgi:hypothetical protein
MVSPSVCEDNFRIVLRTDSRPGLKASNANTSTISDYGIDLPGGAQATGLIAIKLMHVPGKSADQGHLLVGRCKAQGDWGRRGQSLAIAQYETFRDPDL